MRTLTIVTFLVGATAASAAAQASDRFNWHGRIPAGQAIEIKGVNGSIDASFTTGPEVEVSAVKHGRRSNPADVQIKVVPHAGGVTICAVYPAPSGRENECLPGARGRSNTRDNDVEVDFDVKVPAGVNFLARTVNGKVAATDLRGDVDAETVNGSVSASTTGLARARTVNGGIDVQMARADWTGDLDFETVNGSVHVTLPGNASATVEASTVNGSLSTDFPLTVQGRFLRNRISGTIGQGGRTLKVTTVNGSIQLSRR